MKRMCCPNLAAAQSDVLGGRLFPLLTGFVTLSLSLRYVTREDVAAASLSKASSSGGSVRLISKEMGASLDKGASAEPSTR